MDKNEITPINRDFLQGVSDVLAKARKNAKTAVNLSMVYAYFEIGRMIVEEEQHGANRAAYGTQLLKELSAYLTGIYGEGFQSQTSSKCGSFTSPMPMTKLVRHYLTNLKICPPSALSGNFI